MNVKWKGKQQKISIPAEHFLISQIVLNNSVTCNTGCKNVKWKAQGVYEKRQRLTTDRKIGICIVRGLFMIREIGPSKTGHQAAFSKDCTKPKERWNKHGIPFFNSFIQFWALIDQNWSKLSLSLMMLAMKMVISEVARQLWCSCRVTNA